MIDIKPCTRKIDLLVVHCADTYASMDIGRNEIDTWHRERGWIGIGYHYVIRRDGTIEKGRPDQTAGAHVEGHNYNSLGICMVGGKGANNAPADNFTPEQYEGLKELISKLLAVYPEAKVVGHNDLNPHKACPCFSVKDWLKKNVSK